MDRSADDLIAHSRRWHAAFDAIAFGRFPVISILRGAVIGGGLELAASTHVRIAERSAFFSLPEAQRGIFVGGGGSVRISRLIGASRMAEMMLTGRVYEAVTPMRLSLAHYVVDDGTGLALTRELAGKIAANSRLSNFAIVQALPRIAGMSPADGLFTEAVVAALMLSGPESRERIAEFSRYGTTPGRNGPSCLAARARAPCDPCARSDRRPATRSDKASDQAWISSSKAATSARSHSFGAFAGARNLRAVHRRRTCRSELDSLDQGRGGLPNVSLSDDVIDDHRRSNGRPHFLVTWSHDVTSNGQ